MSPIAARKHMTLCILKQSILKTVDQFCILKVRWEVKRTGNDANFRKKNSWSMS